MFSILLVLLIIVAVFMIGVILWRIDWCGGGQFLDQIDRMVGNNILYFVRCAGIGCIQE